MNTKKCFALLRERDGSAIIEFAIVAPLFFLLFFGITEFGLVMYHKIAIERIAVDVSRMTSIITTSGKFSDPSGTCSTTTDQFAYIKCKVAQEAAGLINGDKVQVEINTLAAGGATEPDLCIDDPNNPTTEAETCTTYQELNGINGYQGSSGIIIGNSGSVIEVRINYPWIVQFPLLDSFFGAYDANGVFHGGVVLITASTVIKNEPF